MLKSGAFPHWLNFILLLITESNFFFQNKTDSYAIFSDIDPAKGIVSWLFLYDDFGEKQALYIGV